MNKLICLTRPLTAYENDDVSLTFIMVDSNDDIVTSLLDWTFKGEIEGSADEILLTNSYFTTDVAKIILNIPNADMSLNDGEHSFEIQGTKDSKDYTIFRDIIDIKEEVIDW